MSRVLYVEDNEDNVFMLQMHFELMESHELVVASDGREGLEMASSTDPDLILMDIGLPDLDGLEVTRRLKTDPSTSAIPVIALTAHAMSGDREKALAAGCDDFDTKPIDFERLSAKMAQLLGG